MGSCAHLRPAGSDKILSMNSGTKMGTVAEFAPPWQLLGIEPHNDDRESAVAAALLRPAEPDQIFKSLIDGDKEKRAELYGMAFDVKAAGSPEERACLMEQYMQQEQQRRVAERTALVPSAVRTAADVLLEAVRDADLAYHSSQGSEEQAKMEELWKVLAPICSEMGGSFFQAQGLAAAQEAAEDGEDTTTTADDDTSHTNSLPTFGTNPYSTAMRAIAAKEQQQKRSGLGAQSARKAAGRQRRRSLDHGDGEARTALGRSQSDGALPTSANRIQEVGVAPMDIDVVIGDIDGLIVPYPTSSPKASKKS